MEIRALKNHEGFELDKISNICFSFTNQKETDKQMFLDKMYGKHENWNPDACDNTRYGAFLDNYLAGVVQVPRFTVNFDGGMYDMRGIGGVCAMPAYRKQGITSKIMEIILSDIYTDGAVFSYLYPFSFEFYRKLSYEAAMTLLSYSVPLSACPRSDSNGTVRLCESREDFADAAEVYRIYSGKANMSSVRDEKYWDEEYNKKPSTYGISTYLWSDDGGKPRSYFRYKLGRRDEKFFLDVREICFTDREALQALFSFARDAFEGFYTHIDFTIPDGIDIRFLFSNYYDIPARMSVKGMARIVNVKKAFEVARARSSGTVCIETWDRQIPENTGIWRVEFNPDGVKAEKTGCKPELSAPIHALCPLLIGLMDLGNAEYYPEITIHGNREMLSGLFYRKINWNNENF
ncbi:MAG: GNAT family N-acetyltransferase [Defluviitaleaceae bacterium]|nr:GNAT family N-acetyltransferase [Defluviitaleaceae bacterium]MCL2836404.1 GNAT family N-acetyltransferase [Defluviitaleaceae bacterium]